MLSRFLLIFSASISCSTYTVVAPPAGTLFESAIPPRAGVHVYSIVDGTRWVGHRFELKQSSQITGIGGYFARRPATLFAALVRLDGSEDLPDSRDLSTSDRIAEGVFKTEGDGDVFAEVSIVVSPGWYMVLVGSDALGAEFRFDLPAVMPDDFTDNTPRQLGFGIIQGRTGFFANEGAPRFVVLGWPINGQHPTPLAQ